MKKIAMAVAAALVAGVAGAQGQTWSSGDGQLTFKGCYTYKLEGYVACDMTYTLTKKETGRFMLKEGEFMGFTTDGNQLESYAISLAGGNYGPSWYISEANALKGVPVRVSFLLKAPQGTRQLRALTVLGQRFDNVPVSSGNAPAPTPQRSTTTTPAPVNTSAYNAVMTNCKAGANGTLTCTATLTPRR